MSQPRLVIVGGPNGAGKTTFATEYAERHGLEYLGADLIAFRLSPTDPESQAIAAGRLFLEEIQAAITERRSLVVETTLSGRTLRHMIESARAIGFHVAVVYVFLGSADTCVARVSERIRNGGHSVPENDIRRRFRRSASNFWNLYRPLSDNWVLVYNGGAGFLEVAQGDESDVVVHDEELLESFLSITGDDDG